jgi:hypothetical protein
MYKRIREFFRGLSVEAITYTIILGIIFIIGISGIITAFKVTKAEAVYLKGTLDDVRIPAGIYPATKWEAAAMARNEANYYEMMSTIRQKLFAIGRLEKI